MQMLSLKAEWFASAEFEDLQQFCDWNGFFAGKKCKTLAGFRFADPHTWCRPQRRQFVPARLRPRIQMPDQSDFHSGKTAAPERGSPGLPWAILGRRAH